MCITGRGQLNELSPSLQHVQAFIDSLETFLRLTRSAVTAAHFAYL